MTAAPLLTLNDGRSIPQLGLGVWQTPASEVADAVEAALACGYRHIDTAAIYGNEEGVGDGVRRSDVPRGDIFVTTKVWNDDQGYDATLRAFEASNERLGLGYVDLYLIHWPAPAKDRYVETWKAMIRLREEGRVRSIGVSNFNADHLTRLIGETGVAPVLNQIELHPRFQQSGLRTVHLENGLLTESWSPLGQGGLLTDPMIARIAEKYRKTPAQVIIRWHLDNGLIVIPKSVRASRIAENFDVFDFSLELEDRARIEGMDDPEGRIGPDPMKATF
jgi:Aldo/keto reductases, related to diketogulonate reductase